MAALVEVPITQIVMNPYQPRRQFAPEELEELASSIRTVGLIHPPTVRRVNGHSHFELVAGERRFRAAQLAGLKKIAVIIHEGDDFYSAQAALVENVQRVDLNPVEIARALQELMHQFQLSQQQLAQRIGKQRSTVSNYLRLLTLPYDLQEGLAEGRISMGHAKALLSIETPEQQRILYSRILTEGLSVRQAEQEANHIPTPLRASPRTAPATDIYLEDLAKKIQYKLGTKVSIEGKGHAGKLTIDYYNLDDLDRLLALLNIE